MTKERQNRLLMEVAQQFENGSTPMHHEWLVENNVTLDECGALADRLGLIIRGFLQSPDHIQLAIWACSCMPDAGAAAEHLVAVLDHRRLMDRLKKIDASPVQPEEGA